MNGNTSFLRGLGTCIGLASSSMFLQQEKLTFFSFFAFLYFCLTLLFYQVDRSDLMEQGDVSKVLLVTHYIYTANLYRGLRSVHMVSLQYLWKRAVRITEKPYTHPRERLHMLWGNPVTFTDCGEIL